MPNNDSPNFLEISHALRVKRDLDFELVCNDYLKARYPNLVPRISTNSESTVPGTPDSFLIDDSGQVIAGQYGSSPKQWRTKLFGNEKEIGDAEKVANLARTHGLTIRQLVFCTTAEIDLPALNSAQNDVKSRYGFPAEICDLRRLSSDIESLYPGIAARRLGIPLRLQHFMTIDDYIDSTNQRFWPKRNDIDDGRVFTPLSYLEEIEAKLDKDKHCLLTGLSGSGKSVLAITYGLWRRGDLQNPKKHPEAFVFYLDAASNHGDETGKEWFRQVLAHDYQNGLFIIDNCHLSPAAINAFCFQLSRKPLKQTAVLFISTPKAPESSWEDMTDDYFEHFEQSDSVVEVKPELFYKDVLRQYSEMYRKTDPNRFVDVNVDFADRAHNQQLENLCSHNLVAARALLDAWGKLGGQLSNIHEDEVLNILARRHLTRLKAPALGPLCSLASFEISIHNAFLEQLPRDSRDKLGAENLLILNDSENYGHSYRVALHPQVASQIFRAYVRQKLGSQYKAHVEEQLAGYLKQYLTSGARNFAEVLKRTRVGLPSVQHTLLDDVELQNFIASQFNTISLADVMRYLFILSKRHPSLASSFLEEFYNKRGPKEFQAMLLNAPMSQFLTFINQSTQINPEIAKKALGQLPAEVLVQRIEHARLSDIYAWISPSGRSIAAQLGYSLQWRKKVAENLNLQLLVEKSRTANIQVFMWFLTSFANIAPAQAKLFLDQLTPETLGEMLTHKSVTVIKSLLGVVKKLVNGPDFLRRVATTLDVDELARRVSTGTLSNMYWLTWTLADAIPDISQKLERRLDPQTMLNSFANEGDIKEFNRLWASTSAEFMQRVLDLLDKDLAVTILNRSTLASIAAFLEHRIFWFKSYYLSFANKYLRERLKNTDLADIGTFITRLERAPKGGHSLAIHAAETLMGLDLRARVAESDLLRLSLLCEALNVVDPSYRKRLLEKISEKEIRESVKHSGVQGIRRFIYKMSAAESPLIDAVADELRKCDLTTRIEASDTDDLAHLIWNIRLAIGEDLAQEYCRRIDNTLKPDRFTNVSMIELVRLMWSLVAVSKTADLRIIEYETIHERLMTELEIEPGSCMHVIGVISSVRPDIIRNVFVPKIDLNKIGGPLLNSLRDALQSKQAYRFSLTLQAVWLVDEKKALTLLQRVLRNESLKQDCLALLTEALTRAVTPLSIDVLNTTISRIEQSAAA